LLAEPDAVIEIGPERITVTAELADTAARSRIWPRFLAIYPGYGHYADRREVPPRIFLLHPREAAGPPATALT
jgi:hypothetical protein